MVLPLAGGLGCSVVVLSYVIAGTMLYRHINAWWSKKKVATVCREADFPLETFGQK